MNSWNEFNELVRDAYDHLYDLVYLRTHPLVQLVTTGIDQTFKENAWRLHNLLIQTIQELNPGPQTPVKSNEWRRFQIMELRFLDGLDPQQVADQLFISRRHFYRELTQAIDVCADLLRQKYETINVEGPGNLPALTGESILTQTRLELLRVEAAHFHDANSSINVNKIINEVLDLVDEPASRQGIKIESSLDEYLPLVSFEQSILRQVLFGLFNLLLPFAGPLGIRISTMHSHDDVLITCSAVLTESAANLRQRAGEQLGILEELVEINSAHLQFVDRPSQVLDIILALPIAVRSLITLQI